MAGTIDRVVSISVTKTSASVSQQGFSTALGVHQVTTGVQSERFKTYASQAEMTTAGFLTTDRAYIDAGVKLSQKPSPTKIAIGRRIPGTAQERELIITAAAVGSWTLDLDDGGGVKQYGVVAAAADDEIDIAELFRVQIAQDADAFVTVPLVATGTATVPITAGIAGVTFTAVLTPAGAGTGTTLESVASISPEDLATCLAAIELENEEDWFYFTIDTRDDTDILAAGVFAGARNFTKFFLGQSKDTDLRDSVEPNIASTLAAFSYDNVWLGYHASDLDFHDGGMAGVAAAADLDGANGAITWSLKTLVGVPVSVLTSSQIDNITAAKANVFVKIGGLNKTQEGFAISGEFADVNTSMAWAKARVQESVFAALATNPRKVPFTNAGISVVTSAFLGVLQTGVTNAHFSGDDPTSPNVTAPKSSEVSSVDKNARILRNVVGTAILAGAIHSTVLRLDVSV